MPLRPPGHSANDIRITGRRHSSSFGCRVRALRPIGYKFTRSSRKSELSVWPTEPLAHERSGGLFSAEELPPGTALGHDPLCAYSITITARRDVRRPETGQRGIPVALFAVEHRYRGCAIAQSD